MIKLELVTETTEPELDSNRKAIIAAYTALAKCAHEVADLTEAQQVVAYKQIIREINLIIDDILIDGNIGEAE